MRTQHIGLAACLLALLIAGCAQVREKPTLSAIKDEIGKASEPPKAKPLPPAVVAALAPSDKLELPKSSAGAIEPRFDLSVNNASASQVFLGIASGTRYSMLLHPEVAGSITVNLKDVTVPEAMEAIKGLYGYDYQIDGPRIIVHPITLQTRFYSIPYPASIRKGSSDMRVISGSIADAGKSQPTTGSAQTGSSPSGTGAATTGQLDSSRVATSLVSDFWGELHATVAVLIGCSVSGSAATCPEGRSISVSPTTGMLSLRAYPQQHRLVDDYLKRARIQVERQVMIEAKIIEVTLNEGAQSGINWALIGKSGSHPYGLSNNQGGSTFPTSAFPFLTGTSDFGALNQAATSTITGLSWQTDSFAMLMRFLETQGGVQVLSSPRVSAINNQKAILKVGTDDFFVTAVTTNTSTSAAGTNTATSPTITVQPFFSGIALDVTPEIDEADDIILHVHPSVSVVSTNDKVIDLGTLGTYRLPLASSTVSEADSVVRLKDGQIAAIGGLMKRESLDEKSGAPGIGDIPGLGMFFRSTNHTRLKHELVILIKPTLIRQSSDWIEGVRGLGSRLDEMQVPPVKMVFPGQ